MTVLRPVTILLVLCLGALASFAVACGSGGGDEEKLISSSRAEKIKEELDKIETRVEDGRCDDLRFALERLDGLIDGLPGPTDRRLRDRLQEGVDNLETVSREDCEGNQTETTTTETSPPETIPTTPPETVPPETTPPETTPPPTTTPQTTPPPDQEPPDTPDVPQNPGGEEAPSGGDADFGQRGNGNGKGKAKGKGKD